MRVPFLDLTRQTRALEGDLREVIDEVLASGRFLDGERGRQFESAYAGFCGASDCVAVASGTDALALALRAVGVERGHEVVTSALVPVATVAAIVKAGGTPVLADVEPATFTLDPRAVEAVLSKRTRAIVPVHLYGQCAEMEPLITLAHDRGVAVIEDAAQAHGAEYEDRSVGTLADAAAFSFYPTKNLGALGDGGAVVTDDPDLAARIRLLRAQGEDSERGAIERATHSRLDELQAAVLSVKLARLDAGNERRRVLAGRYQRALEGLELTTPAEAAGRSHVFHLYVIRSRSRDALRAELASREIETALHYPRAAHQHPAFAELARPGEQDEAERAAREVLSLPLYPELTESELEAVASAVCECEAIRSAS